MEQNIAFPCCIAVCSIACHRYRVFNKLKVGDHRVLSKSIGRHHFPSVLSPFDSSQHFKLFFVIMLVTASFDY